MSAGENKEEAGRSAYEVVVPMTFTATVKARSQDHAIGLVEAMVTNRLTLLNSDTLAYDVKADYAGTTAYPVSVAGVPK